MAVEDKTDNNIYGAPSGAQREADATPGDFSTGTVLDYLWMDQADQAGNLPEPGAEGQLVPAHAEIEPEQSPAPCLQTSLERYSRWLDSIGAD